MPRDPGSRDNPNWWVIGAFTASGLGLLIIAYYASSYWQGVLDNGGTALLLFALLAFSEPRLVRHLRQPRTLSEASARFSAFLTPLPRVATGNRQQVKDRVLAAVARTGLHQEPPGLSSTLFTNLAGAVDVAWRVEWDDKGLRHHVTTGGVTTGGVTTGGQEVPRSLQRSIGWDENIASHEERVYKILCYLIHEFEPRARS